MAISNSYVKLPEGKRPNVLLPSQKIRQSVLISQ